MSAGYKFAFDLNAPLIYQENSSNATGEDYVSNEENLLLTETSNTAVLVRNATPNRFDFDLNGSPSSGSNEPPPPLETLATGGEIGSEKTTRTKTSHLSNDERRAIYTALSKQSVNGTLKQGTMKTVANEFSVTIRTVQRIWKRAKETSAKGMVDVSHLKRNCGRKRKQVDLTNVPGQP